MKEKKVMWIDNNTKSKVKIEAATKNMSMCDFVEFLINEYIKSKDNNKKD